jgi:hypothetical protein
LWCVGSALADITAIASTTAETTGTIVFIAILYAFLQGNAVNVAALHPYVNGSHSILVNGGSSDRTVSISEEAARSASKLAADPLPADTWDVRLFALPLLAFGPT